MSLTTCCRPHGDDNEAVDKRDRAIHTVGNLMLVNGRLNSSLSNAPWNSKRTTLADHSVMFLNKHLVNHGPQIWAEPAIEERAKWLHERAVKVWPHCGDIEAKRSPKLGDNPAG